MKKNKNRYIDLSDIKDDDLDKTGSFTDLMSRAEKKEHERKKLEEETRELKEILMNDKEKKELRKKKKKEKRKKKEENNEIENIEPIKEEKIENHLNRTQKFLDLTNEIKLSMLNNVEENINVKEEKKFKIGNIVITDFLIIASLAYYIYTIIFTNIEISQLYLLIGGSIILSMIFLFCLSIISKRILSKVLSILIYLIFIGYILFNLILVLGIIKI